MTPETYPARISVTALTAKLVVTRHIHIGMRVVKQPFQIARRGRHFEAGFAVTAGVRRRAFARADVFLQYDGQRIANIAWTTVFKEWLITIVNRLCRLED